MQAALAGDSACIACNVVARLVLAEVFWESTSPIACYIDFDLLIILVDAGSIDRCLKGDRRLL